MAEKNEAEYLDIVKTKALYDAKPVVRIHSAGAIRVTKKHLEKRNATDK